MLSNQVVARRAKRTGYGKIPRVSSFQSTSLVSHLNGIARFSITTTPAARHMLFSFLAAICNSPSRYFHNITARKGIKRYANMCDIIKIKSCCDRICSVQHCVGIWCMVMRLARKERRQILLLYNYLFNKLNETIKWGDRFFQRAEEALKNCLKQLMVHIISILYLQKIGHFFSSRLFTGRC